MNRMICMKKEGCRTSNEYLPKDQSGFTLVEVVVVMALMVMLFSVTAWGILEWQDFADFVGQEEKATTLFAAAGQRLEQRPITGDFDRIDIKTLLDPKGVHYDENKVWPDSVGRTDSFGNDISNQYRETICYVKCDKGEYEKYSRGERVSAGAEVLFYLLDDYVVDKSILDAAICLEFAPKSRQVFAVLYSTKVDSFVYESGRHATGTTVADISDRSTSYRKQRKIGFYGVDTLYMRVD